MTIQFEHLELPGLLNEIQSADYTKASIIGG